MVDRQAGQRLRALPGGRRRRAETADHRCSRRRDVTENPPRVGAPEDTRRNRVGCGGFRKAARNLLVNRRPTRLLNPHPESSPSPSRGTVVFSAIMSAILGGVVALLFYGRREIRLACSIPPPAGDGVPQPKSDVGALVHADRENRSGCGEACACAPAGTDHLVAASRFSGEIHRPNCVAMSLPCQRSPRSEKVAAAISEIKSAPPQGVITVRRKTRPRSTRRPSRSASARSNARTAALSAAAAAPGSTTAR